MPIGEGYRPFQAQGVRIPTENVGVRLSGRRPGERRLTVLRAAEPEQPRTLLQEMQQYVTTRQSLRNNGYFFLMGKEPENINLADATHNDLEAIGYDMSHPDNMREIMTKGNTTRIERVFDAYAMGKYSPEKKREVLEQWEGINTLHRKEPKPIRFTRLTPAETETVTWLLARIGIPFEAPPEGFKESYSSLLLRMRTATGEHQQQWEQERTVTEERYRAIRRG